MSKKDRKPYYNNNKTNNKLLKFIVENFPYLLELEKRELEKVKENK
jgi:hypothetical protein